MLATSSFCFACLISTIDFLKVAKKYKFKVLKTGSKFFKTVKGENFDPVAKIFFFCFYHIQVNHPIDDVKNNKCKWKYKT